MLFIHKNKDHLIQNVTLSVSKICIFPIQNVLAIENELLFKMFNQDRCLLGVILWLKDLITFNFVEYSKNKWLKF